MVVSIYTRKSSSLGLVLSPSFVEDITQGLRFHNVSRLKFAPQVSRFSLTSFNGSAFPPFRSSQAVSSTVSTMNTIVKITFCMLSEGPFICMRRHCRMSMSWALNLSDPSHGSSCQSDFTLDTVVSIPELPFSHCVGGKSSRIV